jgi:hypothetical protein
VCDFFQIFMNFVSSYAWCVHNESMCTGYIPYTYINIEDKGKFLHGHKRNSCFLIGYLKFSI